MPGISPNALEIHYVFTAKLTRKQSIEIDYEDIMTEVEIIPEFKCWFERGSKTARNNINDQTGQVAYSIPNLFIMTKPEHNIQINDVIEIQGKRYYCDEPVMFDSHQEVSLRMEVM